MLGAYRYEVSDLDMALWWLSCWEPVVSEVNDLNMVLWWLSCWEPVVVRSMT